MKRIRIPIAILVGCSLVGCGPYSELNNDSELAPFRLVAASTAFNVYVVKIDGQDYVIVSHSGGVAITPKIGQ